MCFSGGGSSKLLPRTMHATNVDVYVPSHSLENSARWHGNLIGLSVKGTKLFGPTNAAN